MVTGASEAKWAALIQWARGRAHALLPADLLSSEPDDALGRLCKELNVDGSIPHAANQLEFDFAHADDASEFAGEDPSAALGLQRRKPAQPAA